MITIGISRVDIAARDEFGFGELFDELVRVGADAWPADATMMQTTIEHAVQICVRAQIEQDIRRHYRNAAAACRLRNVANAQRK